MKILIFLISLLLVALINFFVLYHFITSDSQVGAVESEVIDDLEICDKNGIIQYYQTTNPLDDLNAIRDHFADLINKLIFLQKEGFVILRYIKNCEGKTGYIKAIEFNNNYEYTSFGPSTLSLIVHLKKYQSLAGDSDTYNILKFKISNGKVAEIY